MPEATDEDDFLEWFCPAHAAAPPSPPPKEVEAKAEPDGGGGGAPSSPEEHTPDGGGGAPSSSSASTEHSRATGAASAGGRRSRPRKLTFGTFAAEPPPPASVPAPPPVPPPSPVFGAAPARAAYAVRLDEIARGPRGRDAESLHRGIMDEADWLRPDCSLDDARPPPKESKPSKRLERAQGKSVPPTARPETSVPRVLGPAAGCPLDAQLMWQINYYFSDANLASDRFLIERLGADGLGAIPVALIASFPRVAALTDDLTRVTAAMAAIPGLAVYLSVDGSPWVHRLTPIEWGGW